MNARPVQVCDASGIWREFRAIDHAITAWKSAPIGTTAPKRSTMQYRLSKAGPEGVHFHGWHWRYAQAAQEPRVTQEPSDLASGIVDALRGDDGGLITTIRPSDGFINATLICQANGKYFAHYTESNKTLEFLEEMRNQYKIGSVVDPSTSLPNAANAAANEPNAAGHSWKAPVFLVESSRAGGTYVHPEVAVHLAQWCSPKFAVTASRLIWRYLYGGVTTEESVRASEVVAEAINVSSANTPQAPQSIVDPRLPPGFELMSVEEKRGFARKFTDEYFYEKSMSRYKEFEKMDKFNDPRILSRMRDVVLNSVCVDIRSNDRTNWETVSSWLTKNNKPDRYQALRFTMKMGVIAARLFREAHGGRSPHKIKKYVLGEERPVNVYEDGELLSRAFDQAVAES